MKTQTDEVVESSLCTNELKTLLHLFGSSQQNPRLPVFTFTGAPVKKRDDAIHLCRGFHTAF